MRGGQLHDFILLHILKIIGCVNLGFFAKIWLFDILYIFNRCLFEPLILLYEILQLVCNSHHSSFWHNSLCIISFHSSEINLQLLDLTPSEHTSYPDRGWKWSIIKGFYEPWTFQSSAMLSMSTLHKASNECIQRRHLKKKSVNIKCGNQHTEVWLN